MLFLTSSVLFCFLYLIDWGCHSNHRSIIQPYLTVAASIGITNEDIENFIRKLKDCWLNLKDKSVKDGA